MNRFFSRWFGNATRAASAPRPKKRTRLRVETLEERAVPATLHVTSLVDDGSSGTLRSAISSAKSGDTIDINVAGTLTLNAGKDQLVINKNLTIVGLGATEDIITASAKTRVFYESAANVTLNLSGLTITGGRTSGGGGAIDGQKTGDFVNLTNTIVSNSSASKGGGGVDATNLTITNSTIVGNSAAAGGGGAVAQNATVTDSTISGNTAKYNGGGIATTSQISLINSTVSGNTAGTTGGGVSLQNGTNAAGSSFQDDTIASNASKTGGGGIWLTSYVSLTMSNTIIADNTDTSKKAPDVMGKVTALYSLILSTTGTTLVGSTSTDILKQDPKLGVLQNNGGPTQTMALLANSPAINAGSGTLVPVSITKDQRGDPRIIGLAVDIGAFEVQPTDVSTGTSTATGGTTSTATTTTPGTTTTGTSAGTTTTTGTTATGKSSGTTSTSKTTTASH